MRCLWNLHQTVLTCPSLVPPMKHHSHISKVDLYAKRPIHSPPRTLRSCSGPYSCSTAVSAPPLGRRTESDGRGSLRSSPLKLWKNLQKSCDFTAWPLRDVYITRSVSFISIIYSFFQWKNKRWWNYLPILPYRGFIFDILQISNRVPKNKRSRNYLTSSFKMSLQLDIVASRQPHPHEQIFNNFVQDSYLPGWTPFSTPFSHVSTALHNRQHVTPTDSFQQFR